MHPSYLLKMCTALMADGVHTVLYIGPVGNPNYKPFLKLEINPVPDVNKRASLPIRLKQARNQQKVREENKQAVEEFVRLYTERIYNREPEMNTDIQGFFERFETKKGKG